MKIGERIMRMSERTVKIIVTLGMIMVLCISVDTFRHMAHAAPTMQWDKQSCNTLDDVQSFLNKLSPDRALEAKVVTINSKRQMNFLCDAYVVFYRR